MTYAELREYMELHGLGVEIRNGKGGVRDKEMSLTKPLGMPFAELVDHAAKIGIHLKAHRPGLLAEFNQRVHGIEGRRSPFDWRAERERQIANLLRLGSLMGWRVAWFSEYDKTTGSLDPKCTDPIPDKATAAVAVNPQVSDKERDWLHLSFSRPPAGWKWLEGFVPFRDWDRPPDASPPEETKKAKEAKRREVLARRYPEIFANPKQAKTEWVD